MFVIVTRWIVIVIWCSIMRWTRYALALDVDYAKFFSRSHDAVIRVYDEAGNVIETHEHNGDFKSP